MALAGNLLRRLYIWLCTFGYWISKVAGGSSVRCRRRLLKGKEKKSLLRLGRRIHELHQEGQKDWTEDSKVKEVLQLLKEGSRKGEELESQLQEREDRYKDKVQKLKEKAAAQPKGMESETEGEEVSEERKKDAPS